MKRKFLFLGMVAVFWLGVAQADTYLYDATGVLLKAFGTDASSYGVDAALNVSSSSTGQPVSAVPGGQALLAVPVVPQANPTSTGISATANLSGLGGNAADAMNDSGTGGDAVAGDGIYSVVATVAAGTPLGTQLVEITWSDDQNRTWTDVISVDVQVASEPANSSDIPTLPEWGMILMAALLVLLASRNLPRHAAGCALAVVLLTLTAKAQDYPMWQNAAMDLTLPPGGSIGGGTTLQSGGSLTGPAVEEISLSAALSVPDSIDEEVRKLADALGDGQAAAGEDASAKAVRIYNWVRNNIDYEHYHGLVKGSALTLLEGSGNDFDQCALLRDLLVSAGYSSSSVKLVRLSNAVDYADLRDWFGLADEPFPGKTHDQAFNVASPYGAGVSDKMAKQISFARTFLNNLGSGTVLLGDGSPGYLIDGGRALLVFDRIMVALTLDGGASYSPLDPSFKRYAKGGTTNLASASGYSRTTLLTQAGGTADTNSVYGLNTTAIGTYLSARAAALLPTFGSTAVKDLVQGRSIIAVQASTIGEAWQQTSYFTAANLSPVFFDSVDAPDFAIYKAKVRFSSTAASGLDYELPTSDLDGRKITLTFSGNNAELRFDDDTLADTGALGAATTMDMTISVTHPGRGVGNQAETKNYLKQTSTGAACSYAILYGFDASERLLAKRQEQLKAYKDAGKADDSREVRTELLNIMGLTWLYQSGLAHHLLASQNRIVPLFHHRFGRMAQEAGFYVDVGLQYSDDRTDDGIMDDGRFDNAFHLGSLFWSAMEHGVIQQMQVKADGSPFDAVSTVNILRTANGGAGGQKLFLARFSNWAAIKPQLTGTAYNNPNGVPDLGEFTDTNGNGIRDPSEAWTDQPVKNNLEWLINNKEAQLFLPLNANVTQGNWTGTGWVIRAPQIAGMIISGGYSGGYATSVGTVASPVITSSYSYNPTPVYKPPTMPVVTRYTPPPPISTPKYYGSDPVDMGTGAFTFASDDMATGVEGFPRGISFSRYYSSNLATRDDQNIGYGWTHSLHIRAESRTASGEILGMGSPQQAASFLAAIVAASDLYRSDATPKEWGTAALTVGWFVDQMRNSAVAVRMGKDIFQFVVQPDGTYTSPPGSTMALTKVSGTYQLKQRLGNTINFDATGKATNIVDVDAQTMTFAYNADNTINYVQDPVGRRFTFVYTGGRITSVTDSTSRSVSFGFDANGNLVQSTDPEGKNTFFDYVVAGDPSGTVATDHRIVRERNHDNETITQNVYDALGRVERQFLHGDTNKTFHLFYTGRDNFEVNPQGGATHYFYDERGRAEGSIDPDGNTSAIGYDGQDRVVTRTSGANETTVYHYDNAHNLTQIDHPRGGGSTHMDFDSLNRLDLVTDPNGIQTDYVYFGSGNDAGKDRPQSVIAAKGTADQSTTAYTYIASGPAIGRVATITDGDNLTTTKTYDSNGQPDETRLPGNFVINENYSARGNLDSVVDPNGRTTTYSYNQRRQRTGEIADTGGIAATANTTFDNQARTATVTPPADNGGQRPLQSFTYSPTDKVKLEKLNTTTVADTGYDSRDWAATAKDAANRTTTFVRKNNGDLKEAQRPGARTTKFFYDGDSRLTTTSNPGANSGTRNEGFVYNTTAGGKPRTVKTEADGRTVTSEFDSKGQLRFAKDRKGATFEFRYDNLGRRTHVITPQSLATVTAYKKNGRISSVTEPSGDSATFNYNPTTGRLSSVVYSGAGGGTVNYTSYDGNANVLALNENGANGISRAYDGLNRVTSYTFAGQTIGYRYYPSGKLSNLIYPGGTETGVGHVEYTYNADGRLYQVIDKLDSTSSPRTTTYQWNTDGRLQSITRPNGTTRTMTYDTTTGRVNVIAESAGLNWTIGYWSSDDIKTLDVTPAIPANQLSAVPNATMTFDSANQLATFNGQTVTHDLDGNMLTGPMPNGGTALYSYDSRNRLTGVGTTAYTYNAEDNRIGITSPTETTTLVVDPEGALPKVLSRTKNGVTTRYVYGAGLQYEVSSAGAATYYHYDQSGNTAALTNQAGNIIERISYSPYGTIRYRQSNFDTPFLYGGFFAVMTDANGLVNMRARYYNPATMRFVSSDPARANLNWYAYASNPISFADPTGFGSMNSLNAIQTGLAVLGFVPVIGAVADIVNAGISVARGNYGEAALSLAAAVPGIGDTFAAGKIATVAVGAAVAARSVRAVSAPVVTAARVETTVVRGTTSVYSAVESGVTKYVGITDNLPARAAAHLNEKGIVITRIEGLSGLGRADARAVEQVLIETHGLSKNGGTLLNKINSISAKNPIYQNSIERGNELLRQAGYPGF